MKKMNVFEKKSALEQFLLLKQSQKTIGFVPTMGALHQGHLSLMEQSLKENDCTVVSIFVNPTQFNNLEDLQKYPRTLDTDLQKIQGLSQDIVVFAPTIEQMYEDQVRSEKFDFQGIDLVMEGASRPGHFDGVATIVKKLFEIVRPTNAYFGEKDYQQILIIKSMVAQTNLPVNIVSCPIIREKNGLAMSSRNQRLSDPMKQKASFIYQSLLKAKQVFEHQSIPQTIDSIEDMYKNHSELELEYFTIAQSETLTISSLKEQGKKYRAFIVVNAEGVRLIDNIEL